MTRAEIMKAAVDIFGEAEQINMLYEEMGELAQAVNKWRRGGKKKEEMNQVREEIADVQIMLDQMRMIFGPTAIEEVAKINRLEKRITQAQLREKGVKIDPTQKIRCELGCPKERGSRKDRCCASCEDLSCDSRCLNSPDQCQKALLTKQ